jgi:hypothetical protein
MYSNNFVVAIVHDGKFSEETKDGVVALPFEAEYTIRLRNKHNRRAVAKVFIDDENVTQDGIVVPANHYVDLERPVSNAKKFKFVSAKSGEAIDYGKNNKTDGSNGIIRVEWQLEREYKPSYDVHHHHDIWKSKRPIYGGRSRGGPCGQSVGSSFIPATMDEGTTLNFLDGNEPTRRLISREGLQEGCTVAGSHSHQRFTTVHIDLESGPPTVIQLILKGYKEEQAQAHSGVGYCGKCGNNLQNNWNFCTRCGAKVSKQKGKKTLC